MFTEEESKRTQSIQGEREGVGEGVVEGVVVIVKSDDETMRCDAMMMMVVVGGVNGS